MEDEAQEPGGLKEVPSREILAKIEKGESIEYDHVRIAGEIDIGKLNLPLINGKNHISSSIRIASSVFDGTVNLSESYFQNHIDFSKTEFNGSAIFKGSIFSSGANFLQSKFRGSAHFYCSYFEGRHVGFMDAQFSRLATFYNSTFNSNLNFIHSRFMEDVTFKESDFLKLAEFSGSKFDKKAIFSNSKFEGDAKFITTGFGRFTNFRSCSFCKSLNLEGSFISTMFLQDVVFNKATSISLKFAEFSRLEIPWKLIRDKLEYDGSSYLALIKNYNNLEWHYDADECKYQYRTKRRKEILKGKEWFFDFIPWTLYGYGVHIYNPLILLVMIFFVSALFYSLGGQARLPGAFGMSAIILTTTTQVGNLTGPCWYVSIFERITGWLLMSTFLVALAKKTLR